MSFRTKMLGTPRHPQTVICRIAPGSLAEVNYRSSQEPKLRGGNSWVYRRDYASMNSTTNCMR